MVRLFNCTDAVIPFGILWGGLTWSLAHSRSSIHILKIETIRRLRAREAKGHEQGYPVSEQVF